MIVPMKKIYVIVQKKNVEDALIDLQKMGTVHIEHINELQSEHLSRLKENISLFERAKEILQLNKLRKKQYPQESIKNKKDVESKATEINNLLHNINLINDNVSRRKIQISEQESWGNFDPKDVEQLRSKGICVSLVELQKGERDKLPQDAIVETINKQGAIERCIVICKKMQKLEVRQIDIPSQSLEKMHELQKEDNKKLEKLNVSIQENMKYLDSIQSVLNSLYDEFNFEQVKVGMAAEDEISYLKGYCPKENAEEIIKRASAKSWGLLVAEPEDGDNVPTLLKNPKWVDMIKPVFSVINVAPGYKEFDVSMIFLIFFILFVGMLVGDAGYGLLVAGIFGFVHFKLSKAKKEIDVTKFSLVYVLCAVTIIWGVLTGSYFGQKWISSTIPPLVPWLVDEKNLQVLCFFIGAIHLSIAHLWNGTVKFPSLKALSDIGWLFIIWGMFFVAQWLVLDYSMTDAKWMLLKVGAVLVLLFTSPNKNILKAIGPGLGAILLNGINAFTDVVSYIRLYAVGLATVAVADAANDMSLKWIIILHTVNLILAGLAILVHGIRLNILEFSASHLGIEWSGFKFNPFSLNNKN